MFGILSCVLYIKSYNTFARLLSYDVTNSNIQESELSVVFNNMAHKQVCSAIGLPYYTED